MDGVSGAGCAGADRVGAVMTPPRRAWQIAYSQQEADTRAAIVDRPQPTTFTDVARMVARPIIRRCAAVLVAWRAYRRSMTQ